MKNILFLLMISNNVLAEDNNLIFEDNVKSMTDQESSKRIVLKKDPAIFYLKKNNKNFPSINAALEKSKSDKYPIHFKANATTMEIEELIFTEHDSKKKNKN